MAQVFYFKILFTEEDIVRADINDWHFETVE
jgi:hypothetical protein